MGSSRRLENWSPELLTTQLKTFFTDHHHDDLDIVHRKEKRFIAAG